jgi:hypothetical protein
MEISVYESAIAELPKQTQDRLRNCPEPGQGVNPWIFKTALSLTNYFEDYEIIDMLETFVSCSGRAREILRAVTRAREIAKGEEGGGSGPRAHWPAVDYTMAHKAVVDCPVRLKDLRSISPMGLSTEVPRTEEILDVLYPGDPLLCFARAVQGSWTRRREFWRGRASTFSFIVPNPMTKKRGTKSDGSQSERCLDNTGARQFLPIEFDISESGPWAPYVSEWRNKGITIGDANVALHWALATAGLPRFPWLLAVHSGNRSVHVWYPCAGYAEEEVRPFMYRAVGLGADRATWTKCQLVRMPDGVRDNGQRQQVHFFAPQVFRSEGDAR